MLGFITALEHLIGVGHGQQQPQGPGLGPVNHLPANSIPFSNVGSQMWNAQPHGNAQAPQANNGIIDRAANGLTHLWQLIDPGSGANQGAALQRQAAQNYQFTPQFNQIVSAAHPSLNANQFAQNGNLQKGVGALGENFGVNNPNTINDIQIRKGMAPPQAMQTALLHEGLHQQWSGANNQQKDAFYHAYNQAMGSNSPSALALKNFLSYRLNGYAQAPKGNGPALDRGGVPVTKQQYSNIANLSPEIQNEVHSFIPEYYKLSGGVPASDPLGHYYSQFYNPNGPASKFNGVAQTLGNVAPRGFGLGGNTPDWLGMQQNGGSF